MSIIKSLLFGSAGAYNIFGIQVKFQNQFDDFEAPTLEGGGAISRLATHFINNPLFRWMTQGYTHVFVHEMHHAFTAKLITGHNATVEVASDCTGCCNYPPLDQVGPWQKTLMCVAGPMGNVAFSIGKLMAAAGIKKFSYPLSLVLGSGATIWIAGELLYAYVSASKQDEGDFGEIKKLGKKHLTMASAALVTQCVVGIFAAYKCA